MKKNKLATQKTLKAELIGLSGILSATIFSGVGLAMTNFVAAEVNETAVKTATVHVEATCSLTKTVNTAHTVALLGGHVSEDFGTSTFSASCSNPSGYAIYAIGYSDDVMGGTDMVAASPLDSSSNIETGTDGTDSYWAVKLTADGSGASIVNSFNNYHVIPDSYIKVAEKSSATISSEVAFTSKYKISLANTQPAGLYNGKVKYTLVSPSTACPEGYEMKDGICIPPPPPYMQDVATWGSTLALEQSIQAVDQRDNKTYWVTRLCTDANYKTSGTCDSSEIWMTQDLDLVLNGSTLPLTSELSDIGNTGSTNTDSWDPGSTYYTKTAPSSSSTVTDMYSWRPTGNLAVSYYYNPQGDTDLSACADNTTGYQGCNGFSTSKPTEDASGNDMDAATAEHYKLGVLYQWNAATAGTGGTITFQDAKDSICPKGWRLPTSTMESYSFYKLKIAYNASTGKIMSQSPLYFVPGGEVHSGELHSGGGSGFYWTSKADYSNTLYAFILQFNSVAVGPFNYNPRYFGFSVRCVAR